MSNKLWRTIAVTEMMSLEEKITGYGVALYRHNRFVIKRGQGIPGRIVLIRSKMCRLI